MKNRNPLLLCAGLAILLLACHLAIGDGDAPQVMVNEQGVWYRADVQVNQDTLGHTVRVVQGALVDVTLAENPTTGYTWRCTWEPTAAVTLVRSAFVRPTTGLVGAGGVRHFLLLVSQPGKIRVTLQHGQWWDRGQRQQAKRFTIEATAAATPGGE